MLVIGEAARRAQWSDTASQCANETGVVDTRNQATENETRLAQSRSRLRVRGVPDEVRGVSWPVPSRRRHGVGEYETRELVELL